jgi:hypothetical protein
MQQACSWRTLSLAAQARMGTQAARVPGNRAVRCLPWSGRLRGGVTRKYRA